MWSRNTSRMVVGTAILVVGAVYAVVTSLAYADETSLFSGGRALLEVMWVVIAFGTAIAGTCFLGTAVGRTNRWKLKVVAGVFFLFWAGIFFYGVLVQQAEDASLEWEQALLGYAWLTEGYLCIGGFAVGLGARRWRPTTSMIADEVADQLGSDERIVASDGALCATEQRLVRLDPRGALNYLAYSDIRSIGVETKARTFEVWVGILLILVGLWGLTTYHALGMIHFIFVLALGIGLVAFAKKRRQEHYHLGLSEAERAHWAEWEVETGGDPQSLIQAVEAKLGASAKSGT